MAKIMPQQNLVSFPIKTNVSSLKLEQKLFIINKDWSKVKLVIIKK